MKKGWKTGSGTPAEMAAAKVIMKDYTTGRLLHCQLRPDFDPSKHTMVKQNGFNLEVEGQGIPAMPSASNYEEIKVNEPITAATASLVAVNEVSEVESQATTQHGDEESKSVIDTSVDTQAKPAQVYAQDENDFDAQFFGRKVPKVKMNKGEKR